MHMLQCHSLYSPMPPHPMPTTAALRSPNLLIQPVCQNSPLLLLPLPLPAHAIAATGADAYQEGELLELPLEQVLEEGLHRLGQRETWKLWHFHGAEFHDAESFRSHVTNVHVRDEWQPLLPKDDAKSPERPAETALRQRMTELLAMVQPSVRSGAEADGDTAPPEQPPRDRERTHGRFRGRRGGNRGGGSGSEPGSGVVLRDANAEAVCVLLEAMEREHDHLYQSVLGPVTAAVCDLLPVRRAGTGSCRHSCCHCLADAAPTCCILPHTQHATLPPTCCAG